MNDYLPEHRPCAIQRHAGRPQEPQREDEATRWERFLRVVCPWLKEKGKLADDLTEQAARAEADRRTAEARKVEAEARKAGAEADEIAARVDQQRLKNVKEACDLADEQFGHDAALAAAMKLAALDKLSPNIAEQIAQVRGKLAGLQRRHGTQVQIVTDPAALPSPEERQSQPSS